MPAVNVSIVMQREIYDDVDGELKLCGVHWDLVNSPLLQLPPILSLQLYELSQWHPSVHLPWGAYLSILI